MNGAQTPNQSQTAGDVDSNPYANYTPFSNNANNQPVQGDGSIPNPFSSDLNFQMDNYASNNGIDGAVASQASSKSSQSNENHSNSKFSFNDGQQRYFNHNGSMGGFNESPMPFNPNPQAGMDPSLPPFSPPMYPPQMTGPMMPGMPAVPPMIDPNNNMPFMPQMMPGMLNMPMMQHPMENFPPQPFSDIDFNEEVWMQALSVDEKVYFIEVKSQKTQWDKPQVTKNPIQDHKDYVGLKTAYAAFLEKNPHLKSAKTEDTSVVGAKPAQKSKVFIPAEVVEWSKHLSVDNEVFYYNTRTKTSVWDKPDVLKKWEESQVQKEQAQPSNASASSASNSAPQTEPASKTTAKPADKPKTSEPAKKETPKPNKKAVIPVPHSKYLMILQNSGKFFFFDKETRVSSYSVPESIKQRSDLKELENKLREIASKREQQAEEPEAKKAKDEKKDSHIEETINKYKAMSFEDRQKLFKELLTEKKVSSISLWQNELHKIVNDERYLCLDSSERKEVYEKYVQEHAKLELEEKQKQLQQIKSNFTELLKESNVAINSSFVDFSNKSGRDARFKAVEKSRDRERLFDDYQAVLKRKLVEKQMLRTKIKDDFHALLNSVKDQIIREQYNYRSVRKLIEKDSRFQAVEQREDRHEYYDEFIASLRHNRSSAMANSLKEREMEVAKSKERANQQRQRDKSTAQQNDARDSLKAILIDHVRDPKADWCDVKKKVCADQRWENCIMMKRRARDEVFEEHKKSLQKKSIDILHEIYDDIGVNVDSKWSDELKTQARKHAKFSAVYDPSSNNLEKEYNNFVQKCKRKAITNFKSLLREVKLINHQTSSKLETNPSLFKDIVTVLENDNRYLILGKSMKDERRNILLTYIERLEKQGPPPSIHTAATNP